MPAPHEVVAAPLTLFLADVGTDFPDVADAVADFDAAWTMLGTEGDANYDDKGVTVSHNETTSDWTPAGRTMPSKRFRTGESFEITLDLVDISPTMYALVMNSAALTVEGNQSWFDLFRGDQVNSFAVVARGMSSVDNALNLQYEFSNAYVSVDGNVVYKKGDPAALPTKIMAVKHATTDVIRCRIQTA